MDAWRDPNGNHRTRGLLGHDVFSPVTGNWRRVRRPPLLGLGYGHDPRAVLAMAGFPPLAVLAMAGLLLGAADMEVGEWAVAVGAGLAPVLLVASPFLWLAVSDLTNPGTSVEGHVLEVYEKVKPRGHPDWFVVVDDGAGDGLYPWLVPYEPAFGVNARVRVEATRRLHHVRRIQVIEPGAPRRPIDSEHSQQRAGG